MKNHYPTKVLEDKLKEVKGTRDFLIAKSFPYLNKDEIIKIDFVIKDLENSLRLIKVNAVSVVDFEKYKDIYDRKNNNERTKDLAKEYSVCRHTIQRIYKRYKYQLDKY